MGTLIAGLAPNASVSVASMIVFALLNVLLAGNFLPNALLPSYWVWIHKCMPLGWAAKALIINAVYCLPESCPAYVTQVLPGQTPQLVTRYQFFATRFQITYEERWTALANLGWILLAYRLATLLAWRIHHGAAKL
jgi:ABC-type multidrug transport system permease subunit